MGDNSSFTRLSDLEQTAIRYYFKDKFVSDLEEYNRIASDAELLKQIVAKYKKTWWGRTDDSPFTRLSEQEKMAVRYHIRKTDIHIPIGKYNSKCDEIASEAKLMEQIINEYKKYSGNTGF